MLAFFIIKFAGMTRYFIFFTVLFLLLACSEENRYSSDVDFFIICDFEEVIGKDFRAGSFKLKGGKGQTNENAKRGLFALKLDGNNKFGANLDLFEVKKGAEIEAKAWRKLGSKNGGIVISGLPGEDDLYKQSSEIIQEKDGWGLIKLVFRANQDYKKISVYLFNPENEPVFFDDLSISYHTSGQNKVEMNNALQINLSEQSLNTLTRYRERALANGVIAREDKNYVEGNINIAGKEIPIKLRLKGDWTDHLTGEKWSFRIKISGNHAYKGLKTFSIQNPETRNFLYEWFAHKLFEHEDVLTTEYDFVSVFINGNYKGIYALEEHFDKQLLEHRNRREGPIVKFDESGFWQINLAYKKGSKYYNLPYIAAAEILPFKENRTFKTPALQAQFIDAKEKMEQYRKFNPNVGDYFNINAVAKYLALTEILNGKHCLVWHNQRLYFNPVTSLLEPVAFDCSISEDSRKFPIYLEAMPYNPIHLRKFAAFLLQNQEVSNLYANYLKQYSEPSFLDSVFRKMEAEILSAEELIQSDYPKEKFPREELKKNCATIRELLPVYEQYKNDPNKKPWPPEGPVPGFISELLPENVLFTDMALKVYLQTSPDTSTQLALENYHSSPVSVIGYSLKSAEGSMILLDKPISIDGFSKEPNSAVFTELPGAVKKLFYKAENCGDSIFEQKVSNWPYIEVQNKKRTAFQYPFLKQGPSGFIIEKGEYVVSENIIIPKGTSLRVEKGVSINLIENATFFSLSPIEMNGTKEQPIKIFSSDSTGGGLVIISKRKPVKLNYVCFSKLKSMQKKGWALTGAVTIYESKVSLDHCKFENNFCEDALNLVRSSFEVANCNFSNTYADGFDADFCTGTLVNSDFDDIGNDCIDFSGSQVEVSVCCIQNSGDKGVSAGENSTLTVSDCIISGTNIAIASKDNSSVIVDNISIFDCNYAYAAYCKKAEFGPSSVTVNSVMMDQSKQKFLVEKESALTYLEAYIEGTQAFDIDSMYSAFSK